MTAEQNIATVQKIYADFGRGDIPALLAALDENVEWIMPGNLPESGTFRGRAGVATFFGHVARLWEFLSFEPREFIASGDTVVAIGHYAVRSAATRRETECDWVMVWKVREGKIARFQEYTDTHALAAILETAAAA